MKPLHVENDTSCAAGSRDSLGDGLEPLVIGREANDRMTGSSTELVVLIESGVVDEPMDLRASLTAKSVDISRPDRGTAVQARPPQRSDDGTLWENHRTAAIASGIP